MRVGRLNFRVFFRLTICNLVAWSNLAHATSLAKPIFGNGNGQGAGYYSGTGTQGCDYDDSGTGLPTNPPCCDGTGMPGLGTSV
ncbi:MAG: hypothetical protein ACKOA8_18465, partial [Deltaproteobacteria bacterium]